MSDRGRDDRKPGFPHGLSRQDLELWRKITENIEPIDRSRRVPDPATAAPRKSNTAGGGSRAMNPVAKPAVRPSAPAVQRPVASAPARMPGPDLSGIDRRTRQRLFRGQMEIDARIDLHGLRQAEAKIALRGFLSTARSRGHRLVLVITGKGEAPFTRHTLHSTDIYHDPERQGVLRRSVPQWFGESEFRDMVSGFQSAHPKHGGGGAFYVRLRRPRGRDL